MGDSHAPSSAFSSSTSAAAPARLELGTLRNGIGSIQNLELLLKSIKVEKKGLFAAVSAVHADCAPMVTSARELLRPLTHLGANEACAESLTGVLSETLTNLEAALGEAVQAGRVSVARRLKLERDLAHAGGALSAALRLVSLIERAARPAPAEPTPAALVHSASTERAVPKTIPVFVAMPPRCEGVGLMVDMDAAKMLVALGVALVVEGDPRRTAEVSFAAPAGAAPVTTITFGKGAGEVVHIAALRLLEPSLPCAEGASRILGGHFEYSRAAHRACIYWPLS